MKNNEIRDLDIQAKLRFFPEIVSLKTEKV